MESFYILAGIIIGLILANMFRKKSEIGGIIEVDHKNDLCRVLVTTDELSDLKTKTVIFKVNHNAIISREDQ